MPSKSKAKLLQFNIYFPQDADDLEGTVKLAQYNASQWMVGSLSCRNR